jgi:hypothetical protein
MAQVTIDHGVSGYFGTRLAPNMEGGRDLKTLRPQRL